MNRLVLLFSIVFAFPAFAHQGDHTHFDWAGLLAHVFEPDHVIFAGIAVVAALIAYRAGRRAEARAIARKETGHDPR